MFGPRLEYRLSLILREVGKLRRGSRILDGAVGLGQLAIRMHEGGHRVVGIDYAFAAALHVRRTTTIPAVVGDLMRMPFREGVFDAVTTGETLEHLADDAAAVREISRVLVNEGRVIATVPALQSLWSAWDDYYEHLRRYARSQLVGVFSRAGLHVVKAKFWGFPIGLAYEKLFLQPMNKRRARQNLEDDAGLRLVVRAGQSHLLVSAVRAAFSIDALFGWLPYGPCLLLVATKHPEQGAAGGAQSAEQRPGIDLSSQRSPTEIS